MASHTTWLFVLAISYSGCFSVVIEAAPSFHEAENRGNITSPQIPEASGLAASRRHPGILYTHNDHGGLNHVYAVDSASGALRATLTISGAINHDWEDIAVGHCESEFCIYVADIGDEATFNFTRRVYRVKEPAEIRDQTLNLDSTLLFTWHKKDAETLMIDPHGELYVASKQDDKPSHFAHIPTAGNWGTGQPVNVTTDVKFPFFTSKKNPVGGDISPDGTEMLIKFKEWVLYYKLGIGETYEHAITGDPVKLPYHMEPRGESLCWSYNADGYYTTSEGEGSHQPLYFYRRL